VKRETLVATVMVIMGAQILITHVSYKNRASNKCKRQRNGVIDVACRAVLSGVWLRNSPSKVSA
jgi:hypothetical protein